MKYESRRMNYEKYVFIRLSIKYTLCILSIGANRGIERISFTKNYVVSSKTNDLFTQE